MPHIGKNLATIDWGRTLPKEYVGSTYLNVGKWSIFNLKNRITFHEVFTKNWSYHKAISKKFIDFYCFLKLTYKLISLENVKRKIN